MSLKDGSSFLDSLSHHGSARRNDCDLLRIHSPEVRENLKMYEHVEYLPNPTLLSPTLKLAFTRRGQT